MGGIVGFIGLWILKFLNDQVVFVTMVGASSFYFSSSRDGDGTGEVMRGIKYATWYHSGSIAFGSLIMTIINLLKESSKKRGEGRENCIVLCIRCCCHMLVDLLEALNKNAYAYMAITGDTYCDSAKRGFVLWLCHFIEYQLAMMMASWLVFTGTLFITLLNFAVYIGIYKAMDGGAVAIPQIIIVLICSLATTSLCLNQFDECIVGIMMSMAIDEELNGDFMFGPKTFHEKIDEINGKNEVQMPEIKAQQTTDHV